MLTNTLLALKATLSQIPDTKQVASTGRSECDGLISSRSLVMRPAFGAASVPCWGIVEASDETLSLSIAGVPSCESSGSCSIVSMTLSVTLSCSQCPVPRCQSNFIVSNSEIAVIERERLFSKFPVRGQGPPLCPELRPDPPRYLPSTAAMGRLRQSADLPSRRPEHLTNSSHEVEK